MSKPKWTTLFVGVAILVGLAIFLAVNFNHLRRGSVAGLSAPDQLVLYSIDPRRRPGEKPPEGEKFYGFLILGKVEVRDAEMRYQIASALKDALNRDMAAACFDPRHAVRTVENGHTYDFLICFHCNEAELFDGETEKFCPISAKPMKMFNKFLTDNGVPLAPEW